MLRCCNLWAQRSGLSICLRRWPWACMVILCKGGIDDASGGSRSIISGYPSIHPFLHQKIEGLHPESAFCYHLSLLAKPAEGQLRLTHFAAVTAAYALHDMVGAYKPVSLITVGTTGSRRESVQLSAASILGCWGGSRLPFAAYARNRWKHQLTRGCKSWVELDHPLSTDGAVPGRRFSLRGRKAK